MLFDASKFQWMLNKDVFCNLDTKIALYYCSVDVLLILSLGFCFRPSNHHLAVVYILQRKEKPFNIDQILAQMCDKPNKLIYTIQVLKFLNAS